MEIDITGMLEKYRVEHRLTQSAMADKLGTSQPTYCRWICGKSRIASKCYRRIAKILGLQPTDLLPPELDDAGD